MANYPPGVQAAKDREAARKKAAASLVRPSATPKQPKRKRS